MSKHSDCPDKLIEDHWAYVDTKILVRDYEGEDDPWLKRHFHRWRGDMAECFIDGKTSWTTARTFIWRYWKLPVENEK